MKYWTLSVLLLLSAIALRGQIESPAGTLTIYTRFSNPPSAASIQEMKNELDAVMLPFHRRLEWRSLEHVTGHDAVSEIIVVNFKGICQSDSLIPLLPSARSLGWTHIADGEILPFADVDCNQIRELIGSSLAITPRMKREALLGRAMARVLAHELYHVLAHTTRHATSGIAKSSYSGADLACNVLRFDEKQLQIALDEVRQAHAESSPVDSTSIAHRPAEPAPSVSEGARY